MADAEDEGGFDDGRGEQDAQSDVPGAAAAGERGDENPKSDANGEAAVSELAQPASEELAGGPSPGTGLLQLLLGEEEQVFTMILDQLDVRMCLRFGAVARDFNRIAKTWFPWRATHPRQWGNIPRQRIAHRFNMAFPTMTREEEEESSTTSPPGVHPKLLGREWALRTAVQVRHAAALLTSLGEYRQAETLLLRALGEPEEESGGDGGQSAGEMEVAILLVLGRCSATARVSHDHAEAIWTILLDLAKAADGRRASNHFFCAMLPAAVRAAAAASAVVAAAREGAPIPSEKKAEALLLSATNTAWKLLAAEREGVEGENSMVKGLQGCTMAAAEASEILAPRKDPVWSARAQQALGTVAYCRAAYLFDDLGARAWYQRADSQFQSA
ncbi:hypothetical protein T484DRAFT_1941137, partial [Baffinella frigidus]